MSLIGGYLAEKDAMQERELRGVEIQQAKLQLEQYKVELKTQKEMGAVWDKFDPNDPETSLMNIAQGYGQKGMTTQALKIMGSAEGINKKKMEALLAAERAHDVEQKRDTENRKVDVTEENNKAKVDLGDRKLDVSKELADMRAANAKEIAQQKIDAARDKAVQDQQFKIQLQSMRDAEKDKGLAIHLAALRQSENHFQRLEADKTRKEAASEAKTADAAKRQEQAQAGARIKSAAEWTKADKTKTGQALAAIADDPLTQGMTEEQKTATAKRLAGEAGAEIGKKILSSKDGIAPTDINFSEEVDKKWEEWKAAHRVEAKEEKSDLYVGGYKVPFTEKKSSKTVVKGMTEAKKVAPKGTVNWADLQ